MNEQGRYPNLAVCPNKPDFTLQVHALYCKFSIIQISGFIYNRMKARVYSSIGTLKQFFECKTVIIFLPIS